jgi:ADP-dependent NAD(P)H-hydrate dehydratase / NAD(P)H-hydrate epimerase
VRPIILPSEAARLDQDSTVPIDVLMERAGRAVGLAAAGMGARYGTRVTVLAGPGNNGGDGYVAARLLRERGAGVEVLSLAEPGTEPARNARSRARAAGVPISALRSPHPTDLVIDALFGGGFRSGMPRLVNEWIDTAPSVLAVDVPTGLDPASGAIADKAFRATRTVTFHALKVGHMIGSGPDVCGVVTVADIGLEDGDPELLLTEEGDALRPSRSRTAHKWSSGSVLIVGGGPGMTGAAVMAGKAALGFGAGAVGLAVPEEAAGVAAAAAPELLHYSIDDLPMRYDVLVIGPGLGTERADLVTKILSTWEGPMVIDADALTAIAPDRLVGDQATGLRSRTVITPHAGEFERLTGRPPSYSGARDLANRIGATVLLKGNPTFVTDGGVPWLVNTGGPELATIGTGDVLAGMTAALLAGGHDPVVAARAAAYWHGRAGADLARTRVVTALRLVEEIGEFR